jgi:glycosyltransferase involved in cell wall biosynthesis
MSPSSAPVSAILLSFNCERFIRDALAAVLQQDHSPLEVLVSDDASTDGTLEILESEIAAYHGPHRIILRQRDTNSGSKSAHLNDAIGHCSGRIIVSFDGDDLYRPDRVSRLVEAFESDSMVRAVYSGYDLIDENGRKIGPGKVPHPPEGTDPARWFARVDSFASGSTLAVHREVFELFGPLDPAIHEDVVLPFRASLIGRVRYLDFPLASARRHSGSLTADDARFSSLDAYRARMLSGIEKARHQLASRLADLDRATEDQPHRRVEFDRLRQVAADSLAAAESTAALTAPGFLTRLRALTLLLISGNYPEDRLTHAMLALAPDFYLRRKRRQRSISQELTSLDSGDS